MITIDTQKIYEAVYTLCLDANTKLDYESYHKIVEAYEKERSPVGKSLLASIIQNAKIAEATNRPLCQDCGQVMVFLKVGQKVFLEGKNVNDAINEAVEDCYEANFLRKSVVCNALFDRKNTKTNTPAIIYTEIADSETVEVLVLLKGGGAENLSGLKMFTPNSTKQEIKEYLLQMVQDAGEKSCPPLFLGIGLGGTTDYACLLSKKALFSGGDDGFALEVKNYLNEQLEGFVLSEPILDVKILSSSTHIASLPVALTINCHSNRHRGCVISQNGINYFEKDYEFKTVEQVEDDTIKRLNTKDIESIRNLKVGENILLSGEIYTARDVAHQRLFELLERGDDLPIDLKDKIIFYAGPAPTKQDEIIGPFGPTTSARMDVFAPKLYDIGLLATIGKGERSGVVHDSIIKNGAVYFSVTGGVSSLLAQKVVKSEVVLFEELLSEAVYRLEIKDFSLKVEISAN